MATIEERVTAAEESAKSAHHRIDEMNAEIKDIHTLATAMAKMNTRVEGLTGDMVEIKTDIKLLAARPGDLWDKISTAAIVTIATGVVTAVLAIVFK